MSDRRNCKFGVSTIKFSRKKEEILPVGRSQVAAKNSCQRSTESAAVAFGLLVSIRGMVGGSTADTKGPSAQLYRNFTLKT